MKKSLKFFLLLVILAVIILPVCNSSYADMISIPIEDYKKLNQKQIQEKVEKRRLEIEKEEEGSVNKIKDQDEKYINVYEDGSNDE